MKRGRACIIKIFIFTLAGLILFAGSASSITIKEEEELAREFMKIVMSSFDLIEDPLIVDYVNKIGKRIVATLPPPQPYSYRFFVVKEDVYNAFATPAGNIFIYSGLIEAMDNEEELAGILAHEVAHVQARHISQKIERSKKIGLATLAGIAAGIFLGSSSSEIASAVTLGSIAAGQTVALAYSRENEIQADQLGLNYLTQAGYSGEGLLTILNKIRAKHWYGSEQVPSYLSTHPAVEDRLAYLDTRLANTKNIPSSEIKKTPYDFKTVHTRLIALFGDERAALNQFKTALEKNPTDPMAYFGYGLVQARTGHRREAVEYLRKALERKAFSPEILTALGRVYFLDGRYVEAVNALEGVISVFPDYPEALFFLGRTQLEMGQLQEAETSFQSLLNHSPEYRQAYYFLGVTYGKQRNLADAHYTLGIYHLKMGNPSNARKQFEKALENTADEAKRDKIEKLLRRLSGKDAEKRESDRQTNEE
ncbi:MAG: M48 family metalloprotease [Desulfobacterales bacterium]|jgi:predicted Zn-dependent protease